MTLKSTGNQRHCYQTKRQNSTKNSIKLDLLLQCLACHLVQWSPSGSTNNHRTFIKISKCFDIYWRVTRFRCITRNLLVLWYFGSIYFSRKANNNRRQSKINLAFLCVSAPDSVAWKVQFHICFNLSNSLHESIPRATGRCMSKGMGAFNYFPGKPLFLTHS